MAKMSSNLQIDLGEGGGAIRVGWRHFIPPAQLPTILYPGLYIYSISIKTEAPLFYYQNLLLMHIVSLFHQEVKQAASNTYTYIEYNHFIIIFSQENRERLGLEELQLHLPRGGAEISPRRRRSVAASAYVPCIAKDDKVIINAFWSSRDFVSSNHDLLQIMYPEARNVLVSYNEKKIETCQ